MSGFCLATVLGLPPACSCADHAYVQTSRSFGGCHLTRASIIFGAGVQAMASWASGVGGGGYRVQGMHTSQRPAPWCTCTVLAPSASAAWDTVVVCRLKITVGSGLAKFKDIQQSATWVPLLPGGLHFHKHQRIKEPCVRPWGQWEGRVGVLKVRRIGSTTLGGICCACIRPGVSLDARGSWQCKAVSG